MMKECQSFTDKVNAVWRRTEWSAGGTKGTAAVVLRGTVLRTGNVVLKEVSQKGLVIGGKRAAVQKEMPRPGVVREGRTAVVLK